MAGLTCPSLPERKGLLTPGQVLASDLVGLLLRLVNVDLPQVGDVLGAGLVAELGGGVVVKLEGFLGGLQAGGQQDQRVRLLGGPLDRLDADGGGNPDGRVGLLERPRPGIDIAIVVVFALPAPGAGGGPCLDEEVVGFLEALPVEVGRSVVGVALPSAAPHEAGDEPPVGDHVDHGQLLGQPEWVVPDGQYIAQDDDLGLVGDAGEDGRADVGDALHTEGSAVVLVQHQGVEAHLLGEDLLVQVAVVEAGANLGVVILVADAEVGGLGAHQPGLVILPGLFGEVANEHIDTSRLGCVGLKGAAGDVGPSLAPATRVSKDSGSGETGNYRSSGLGVAEKFSGPFWADGSMGRRAGELISVAF